MQLLTGQPAHDTVRRLINKAQPLPVMLPAPEELCDDGIVPVLAIASTDEAALVVPAQTPQLAQLIDAAGPWCSHKAKEVHRSLLRTLGSGPNRWACTMVTEQLLAGGRPVNTELSHMGERYLGQPIPSAELGFAHLADQARHIAQIIGKQIQAIQTNNLFEASKLEAGAVAPIAEMEFRGMGFDKERWQALTSNSEAELHNLRTQIASYFADKNLLECPQQSSSLTLNSARLRELLHADGHQLPNNKRATLAQLPSPLGPWLSRLSSLEKLVSSYGQRFLKHVGEDGRIRATFEQIGASTGRMACHSPNLQSIVSDPAYRNCFRCPPDRQLVVADYATCELRILAELSADPVFQRAFANDEDLHASVATHLFGRPVSKTENPELRARAKTINFGLVYGMGPAALGERLGIDPSKAKALLKHYFTLFPAIGSYLAESAAQSVERGYAQTVSGRRLYLPNNESPRRTLRIARNLPIQGSSADITKLALANLHRTLRQDEQSWPIHAIHDEIVIETSHERAEDVADIVGKAMKSAGKAMLPTTPMAVDVVTASVWQK